MKRSLLARLCAPVLMLAVTLVAPALAQDAALPAPNTLLKAQAAPVTLAAGSSATVTVHCTLQSGWHVNANPPSSEYSIPIEVKLTPEAGLSAGKPVYPQGKAIKLSFDENPLKVYDGGFDITFPLDAAAAAIDGAHTLKGKVAYQACNDQVCLPPTSIAFTLDVTVTGGAKAGSTPPATDATGTDTTRAPPSADSASATNAGGGASGLMTAPPKDWTPKDEALKRANDALAKGGLWWFLFLFGGGILLNLTPCVFPMLGITISIFGARRKEAPAKVFMNAVVYVLGICLMYSSLGVIAALTGGLFGSALQNPLVSVGLGVLFVALSLSMFGVYELQAPGWLLDKVGGANTGSVVGLFIAGLAVGVVAAPCVGAFILSVLVIIAQKGDVAFGFETMFALSLGLGFPYLFLATFSNLLQSLPRAGEWMDWVKKLFGVIMAAYGLQYVLVGLAPHSVPWVMPTGLLLGGLYLGFMEKSGNAKPNFRLFKRALGTVGVALGVWMSLAIVREQPRGLIFKPYDEKAVAASRAAGHGVILDFGAEWCVQCHELDAKTFPDAKVAEAARGFDAYKVDLTSYQSAESEQWRKRYAIAGLPTVVFLTPAGDEVRAARVEGFVSPEEFVKRLHTAAAK